MFRLLLDMRCGYITLKTTRELIFRCRGGIEPSATPAPEFQGVTPYARLSSGPQGPIRRAVWGGAAVLGASGASLVAGGPTRGLTEQDPARVGASRLGLWGERRRHPSRPISAEKIAVVLFKFDIGARGPWLSGPPRPGSESFQRPTPHPGRSSEATAVSCGHRRG